MTAVNGCLSCALGAVNAAFARELDAGDVDRLIELFTDDAEYDNGRVKLVGIEELEPWFRRRAAVEDRTTRHMWSALQIVSVAGDEVETVSTWVCYAANQSPPVDFVAVSSVADFEDVFRRDGEQWLIRRRRIRSVFRDPSVAPRL